MVILLLLWRAEGYHQSAVGHLSPFIHECRTYYLNSRKTELVAIEGVLQSIPGDLSRPHHPEFADALTILQTADDLFERIGNPDLMQHAAAEDKPLELLRQEGIFCEHPLKIFA